jgi:hypothetical protein
MKSKILAAAALAVALSAAPAFAEDLVFMLNNQSVEAVSEFYVSTLDSDNWGEDILGQDVLPSGETATVTITGANEMCEFDIRLVYEGGSITDERKIDLCDLNDDTYSIYD